MDRNEDYSENVNYTSKGLPVLTSDEHLSELATYRELMHWHPDYEFILVKDGVLDFDVNGEILHIKPNPRPYPAPLPTTAASIFLW